MSDTTTKASAEAEKTSAKGVLWIERPDGEVFCKAITYGWQVPEGYRGALVLWDMAELILAIAPGSEADFHAEARS